MARTANPTQMRTAALSKRRRAGRPTKLSAGEVKDLRNLALERPELSLDDLTQLFVARSGTRITPRTASAYLVKVRVRRVRRRRGSSTQKGEIDTQTSNDRGTKERYGYTEMHRDPGSDERYPGGLMDTEWELVADLFEHEGPGKPPKYLRRTMVDACCYTIRAGCPWRMLPKDLPPWQNVYAHFRRWTTQGVFERMHDRLRSMWREREHRAPEPTAAIIDSQSVKTSEQGGPKGYDAGKKVKGRKRHLLTDTLGLLLAVLVHTADIQDRDGSTPLVDVGVAKYPSIEKIYADSAYAGKCAAGIKEHHGVDVEIIRRPTGRWQADDQLPLFKEQAGFVVLPRRWVIERTNAWNGRPRRLVKDQDRRLDVSTAWVWFAEARILLRRLAQPTAPVAVAT